MRAVAFILTMAAVPLAAALPQAFHGAATCETADAQADAYWESTWYEFCGGAMAAGAVPSISYTQSEVGCEGNSCTYAPVFHVALSDALAPGEWIVRATSHIRHYPNPQYVLPGSQRSLECAAATLGSCTQETANVQVVGSPFHSAKWEGEFRLYWVDPTGVQHLQSTGTGGGWLAQYYQP